MVFVVAKNDFESDAAVTNVRFASLHGLPVGPVPLSTTPVPLLKPHARHELVCCRAADGDA